MSGTTGGSSQQTMPFANSQLVDKDGVVTDWWYRFFHAMFVKTGGSQSSTTTGAYLLAQADELNAFTSAGGLSLGTLARRSPASPSVLDFGAIGDGASHPLSAVTNWQGQNTQGWSLPLWQTIFPLATSLSNELNWCAFNAARGAVRLAGTVSVPPAENNYYGFEQFPLTAGPENVTWELNGMVSPTAVPVLSIGTDEVITSTTAGQFFSNIQSGSKLVLGTLLANQLTASGSAAGAATELVASGTDTNIGLRLVPKNTGVVETLRLALGTVNGAPGLFDGSDALEVTANPAYTGVGSTSVAVGITASGQISSGAFELSSIAIADDVQATQSLSGVFISHTLGNGFTSGRSTLAVALTIAGAPNASAAGDVFSAMTLTGASAVNLGGTSASPAGSLITQSIQTALTSGATWYLLGETLELGLSIATGASAVYGNVLKLLAGSPQAGSASYTGLAIGAKASGGFLHGICFAPADTSANPINATTGTLIGSQTAGGATLAAAYGMDLSLWTFSQAAIKSTGFSVDGTGNVRAATTTINSSGGLKLLSQTSGSGTAAGTLTNSPVAGNPTFWLPVQINGTTYYLPAWT